MIKLKNIILKRKKIVIFILFLILIAVYFISTRKVYYIYYTQGSTVNPKETDAEYLNVWDLRFAFDDSHLKNIGIFLLSDVYRYKGILCGVYKDMISKEDFAKLYAENFEDSNNKNSDVSSELFFCEKIEAKRNGDRAIIFFRYYYKSYDNKNNIFNRKEKELCRIYLKEENGKWIVDKVFM